MAAAAGVPVRALGVVFLVLVGVTAGEATQAVGALLLLGLLSGPAAAAQRLTARPFAAMAISVAVAVAAMWAGLALAYAAPKLPPSFTILAFSTGAYVATLAGTKLRSRSGRTAPRFSVSRLVASGDQTRFEN